MEDWDNTLHQEIKFLIELLLGTIPICIPHIRCGLKESRELKAQSQELIDKWFIKPSMLTGDALVLFIEMKGASLRMCFD